MNLADLEFFEERWPPRIRSCPHCTIYDDGVQRAGIGVYDKQGHPGWLCEKCRTFDPQPDDTLSTPPREIERNL